MSRFKIGFKLMDLDELLALWPNREQLLGAVYWMSYGWYWFELDGQLIPTSHPDWLEKYPEIEHPVGIDYQVLRLYEDLQDLLPFVLEPIPHALAATLGSGVWERWSNALVSKVADVQQDGRRSEVVELAWSARYWWRRRGLDTGYLVAGPELDFWSPDTKTIQIRWNTHEKRIEGTLSMIESAGK